jgi:hypothetical protein
MLEQFLIWDADEIDAPVDPLPPAQDVAWCGHILAIRRDFVYITPSGYLIRQCWTSRELSFRHPDAQLIGAAVLVCADVEMGDGRTEAIDVWHLRDGERQRWSRDMLLTQVQRLRERLDEVAAELP